RSSAINPSDVSSFRERQKPAEKSSTPLRATRKILGIGKDRIDTIGEMDAKSALYYGLSPGVVKSIQHHEARRIEDAMQNIKYFYGGNIHNTLFAANALGTPTRYLNIVGGHKVRDRRVKFDVLKNMQVITLASPGTRETRTQIAVLPDGEYAATSVRNNTDIIIPRTVLDHIGKDAQYILTKAAFLERPSNIPKVNEIFDKNKLSGGTNILHLENIENLNIKIPEIGDMIKKGRLNVVIGSLPECKIFFGLSDHINYRHLTFEEMRDQVIANAHNHKIHTVCTLGSHGAVIIDKGSVYYVPAKQISDINDKIGAGDAFAGGYLAGLARHLNHREAAEFGNLAAVETLEHQGPRAPLASLKPIAEMLENHSKLRAQISK
ncbi:MAG: carbohydrate kinase family protein, partial [Pseudomonadota bacterium]